MSPDILISISHLTRKFKEKIALDGIDLDVQRGELFGLVGPDGAGKTTLLRILAGLLSITEGEVQIDGKDLGREAENLKARIGYMAQEFSLYEKLTVVENLQFFGEFPGCWHSPGSPNLRIAALESFPGA
jgi:ABC-2 type transport system ATP-binding protein